MNDDWYQFLFGRPSPGTSTTVPVLDYLRAPERAPEVRRAGEVVEGTRERATPPDAPRWAQRATETNARRNRNTAPEDARLVSMPIGPGGVTGDPPEPEPAPRVPFAVASGQDTEPFGDDFAAWYEATRGRPLPSSIMMYREEPDPVDAPAPSEGRSPNNPNNVPLGTEGGETLVAEGPEGEANRRVRRVRMEPIEPINRAPEGESDLMRAIAAERAAYERQRQGRPSVADMIMLAVFGSRPRVRVVEEENAEMRRRIAQGD